MGDDHRPLLGTGPGTPPPTRPRRPRRTTRNRASGSSSRSSGITSPLTRQAGWVDIATGLGAVAEHAKRLGYEAVVLFLDELVVWLAFSVQDREFFRRKSQKLTKLVKSARLLGDPAGFHRQPADGPARYVRGRGGQRGGAGGSRPGVPPSGGPLRPKSYSATTTCRTWRTGGCCVSARTTRRPIRSSSARFARLDRRSDIWDVLLDGIDADDRRRGADEAAFRLTCKYRQALVFERCGRWPAPCSGSGPRSKVMQQMLVDRRATLTVDDVRPRR